MQSVYFKTNLCKIPSHCNPTHLSHTFRIAGNWEDKRCHQHQQRNYRAHQHWQRQQLLQLLFQWYTPVKIQKGLILNFIVDTGLKKFKLLLDFLTVLILGVG